MIDMSHRLRQPSLAWLSYLALVILSYFSRAQQFVHSVVLVPLLVRPKVLDQPLEDGRPPPGERVPPFGGNKAVVAPAASVSLGDVLERGSRVVHRHLPDPVRFPVLLPISYFQFPIPTPRSQYPKSQESQFSKKIRNTYPTRSKNGTRNARFHNLGARQLRGHAAPTKRAAA